MSQWLNNLLTNAMVWLLDIEKPEVGTGMQWRIDGTWDWSAGNTLLLMLLIAVAIAVVAFFYHRERSSAGRGKRLLLASMRIALIVLIVAMLYDARLMRAKTSLPFVVVMVDESASMETIDRYDDAAVQSAIAQRLGAVNLEEPTRLNLAKAILLQGEGKLLTDMNKTYKLLVYFVGDGVRQPEGDDPAALAAIRDLEPVGQASRLGMAVKKVLNDLRGTQPAAVVLLTDGITTDGPGIAEAAAYARRKAVPLYLVGLGSSRPLRDLQIGDLLVDDVVFVNDFVDFDFEITPTGLEGQEIEVELRKEGDSMVLDRQRVIAGDDGQPQRVRLSHRPTSEGTTEYVVEIVNLKKEFPNKSLKLTRTIDVRDEQIKVLLASDYPSYEFRYLKHLLERDDSVELHTVLQEADERYAEKDQSALRLFPINRSKLFEYDVLILGDLNPAYPVSVLNNISDFVTEKGGGLLFVSGPRYSPAMYRGTPLADLLPFDVSSVDVPGLDETVTEGFIVQPTQLGMATTHLQLGDTPAESERIWATLPDVYWMAKVHKLKPSARVLAEHPSLTGNEGRPLPLICMQHLPPGKVIWHATDETYRWRYRLGDVIFARYWIQTIRYLSRSKLLGKDQHVELTTDKIEYRRGEQVQLRVRFFDDRIVPAADDGVTLVVESEGQKKRRVRLQRTEDHRSIYEGMLTNLGIGDYRAWVASPAAQETPAATNFEVQPPPGEAAQRSMDARELAAAAKTSRGRYYDFLSAERLAEELPAGRRVVVESLSPLYFLEQSRMLTLLLGLFLVLLVSEWVLRKRSQMV